MSWWEDAGCLNMDTELFFPHGVSGPALDQANQAKAVCATCPVAQACLEWALKTNQLGVWGGKTEEERRALRRKRR